jgi:hypothetical protein
MTDLPEVGACYNYGGDNYEVTRVDPDSFLVLGSANCWVEAIEFTDKTGEGETATVRYVMPLEDFVESYESGELVEGEFVEGEEPPEAAQLPADAPAKPGQLPADQQPKPEAKG